MLDSDHELLLAECVEEYHQRRALGERVAPEEWEDRLGEHFGEFREVILTASSLDDLVNPVTKEEKLPRKWGRYTLLEVLGRGAMGHVYRASDQTLGRVVALKILRHGYENDPVAVERFRREARACAQIQHDHVITILDSGVNAEDGLPYYAMPIVEGESLQELIKAGRVPEPRELCEGLAGVADALAELHEKGIVHRDVKPGNIMVDANGRMLLADFGLARTAASETLTQTGQAMGTPLYMSPEQVLGSRDEIDGRSDVYGLGVTLYEALAGRPPFKPADYAALMRMIVSEQAPDLRKTTPEVPGDLARIAMTAIEKDKDDRYASAAAMRDDLRAWAEGQAVVGRPVSPFRRRWRKSRRSILLAASVLLAAILLWNLIPPKNGFLSIETRPAAATVIVGGQSVGNTPIERLELSPGSYIVLLSHKDCEEEHLNLEIEEGEKSSVLLDLTVKNVYSPEALDAYGDEMAINFDLVEPHRSRGGQGDTGFQVLYPRGKVRVGDLTEAAFELGDMEMDISGHVEIRRNGEVLMREPLPSNPKIIQPFPIPELVRSSVRPGDSLRIGYYPLDGKATYAVVVVVEDRVTEDLARIDARLARQPEVFRDHLKAKLLFDAELYTAAYLMAWSITRRQEESVYGWMLRKKSLEQMGIQIGMHSNELLNEYDEAKRKFEESSSGN